MTTRRRMTDSGEPRSRWADECWPIVTSAVDIAKIISPTKPYCRRSAVDIEADRTTRSPSPDYGRISGTPWETYPGRSTMSSSRALVNPVSTADEAEFTGGSTWQKLGRQQRRQAEFRHVGIGVPAELATSSPLPNDVDGMAGSRVLSHLIRPIRPKHNRAHETAHVVAPYLSNCASRGQAAGPAPAGSRICRPRGRTWFATPSIRAGADTIGFQGLAGAAVEFVGQDWSPPTGSESTEAPRASTSMPRDLRSP